jgi:hypothetical protein
MAYEIWETCMLVPGISRSNCSGWVQAWGSIIGLAIAIGVPLWLKVQERKDRRDETHALAEVTVNTLVFDLAYLTSGLRALLARWDNEIKSTQELHNPKADLESLRFFTLPSEEQLLRLAPVWPSPTRKLIAGRSCFNALFNKLTQAAKNTDFGIPIKADTFSDLSPVITLSLKQFSEALEELRPVSGFKEPAKKKTSP